VLPRLIIGIAILTALLWYYQRFQKTPRSQRRSFLMKHGLAILAVVLVLLAITGRMHWVGALIGVVLPVVRNYLPLLIRYMPFLAKLSQSNSAQAGNENTQQDGNQQHHDSQQASGNSQMNRQQALDILGLSEGADKEAIITAHRTLMQKLHPDRGGNDFLAAQLNQAKDLLLS